MEKQLIAGLLRGFSRQLNEFQQQAFTIAMAGGDRNDRLLALMQQQEEQMRLIRLCLQLYARGNPELTELVERRLYEIDLETLLGGCAISRPASD